jgi:hypothetical protein
MFQMGETMTGMMMLIIILVFAIYLYMRHKSKKNSAKDINTVQDYHESYRQLGTRRELRDKNNVYRTYVTKYNSSEDYRERDGK